MSPGFEMVEGKRVGTGESGEGEGEGRGDHGDRGAEVDNEGPDLGEG